MSEVPLYPSKPLGSVRGLALLLMDVTMVKPRRLSYTGLCRKWLARWLGSVRSLAQRRDLLDEGSDEGVGLGG